MSRQVRVVVVNFNGGDLTMRCLDSLRATALPPDTHCELILVDNASTDGVVGRVRAEAPDVRVIASPVNRGFGGGCNLALADLNDVDFVALINNDAVVGPGWLLPLVAALDADARLGAASPKILFDAEFHSVELEPADPSAGVVLYEVRERDGPPVEARHGRGFGGPEPYDGGWRRPITGPATLFVAADTGDARGTVEALLVANRPTVVVARSGTDVAKIDVGREPAWCPLPTTGSATAVVNNAGNILLADGYGADRGFGEPDRAQYDAPEEVFAWCGGAVLMRAEYLRSVGLFDERLFLYYEDLELAWRGRRHGWRYRYVPDSVVRHLHAASTGEWSKQAEHHKDRNRLVVLTRHAPARVVARELIRFVLISGSYLLRDGVRPLVQRRRPQAVLTRWRLGALIGWIRLAPAMLSARRTDRRKGALPCGNIWAAWSGNVPP